MSCDLGSSRQEPGGPNARSSGDCLRCLRRGRGVLKRTEWEVASAPPNAWPMHWWPMQTPKSGKSGPSSLHACKQMPDSSGAPAERWRLCEFAFGGPTTRPLMHKEQGCSAHWIRSEPGPGEMRIPRGFIARISSHVFSSFLNTTSSTFSSQRYCTCAGGVY